MDRLDRRVRDLPAGPRRPRRHDTRPRRHTEDYEALREELGLNDPTHVQYLRWMGNLARGDFGKSITHGYAEVSGLVFPALGEPWNWLLSPYSWP